MAPVGAQSPRFKARVAGAFYLLNIVTGAAAMFLRGPLSSAVLLVATASYIVVTVLLYQLFRAVHRKLSTVAAGFSLIGCAISGLTTLHLASIGLSPLVFFGFYCLLIGYLIVRSTFLPHILGGLLAVGGLGWLTFLSAPLSRSLSPYNMVPGVLSEAALAFWLLTIGVSVECWTAQNRVSNAA